VAAIAESPSLAAAYRVAKASGDWAQTLSADLAGECRKPAAVVRSQPARVVALRRHPFAMAAAVSAMAIGAVFVGQRLQAPVDPFAENLARIADPGEDSIAVASFDSGRS